MKRSVLTKAICKALSAQCFGCKAVIRKRDKTPTQEFPAIRWKREVKRSVFTEDSGVFGKAENAAVREILLNKEEKYGCKNAAHGVEQLGLLRSFG